MIVNFLRFGLLSDEEIRLCSMTMSVWEGLGGISSGIPGGKGASFPIPFDDKLGGGGFDGELSSCPGNRITFFQNKAD